MKGPLFITFFVICISSLQAQPCKQIKTGMTTSDVLILVGIPTEVDTVFSDIPTDGIEDIQLVWQYGDVMKDGNQRVEFTGNKVTDVIADGKKYDALLKAFQNGDVPKGELSDRIEKLNREGCK